MDKKSKLFRLLVAFCVALTAVIANYIFLNAQRPQSLTFIQVKNQLDPFENGNEERRFHEDDFEPVSTLVTNPNSCNEKGVFVLWENRYAFFDQPVKRHFEKGEMLLVTDLKEVEENDSFRILGPFYFESFANSQIVLKVKPSNNKNDTTGRLEEWVKEPDPKIYSIIRTRNPEFEQEDSDQLHAENEEEYHEVNVEISDANNEFYSSLMNNEKNQFLQKGDWIELVVNPPDSN